MNNFQKNSYLQSRSSGVSPRIINRSVHLAMVKGRAKYDLDTFDALPPFIRVPSAQPCTPMYNYDISRRPLALGHSEKVAKLRRELHSSDRTVVEAAVNSLCDITHDPELGYMAIAANIIDRLADLMQDPLPAFRERICALLIVLAGSVNGKESIVRNSKIIENMKRFLDDVDGYVRMKNAALIETIAFFWRTADYLVDFHFVELLMECIEKDDVDIVCIHLQSVEHLMYFETGKKIAYQLGGFFTFHALISDVVTAIIPHALKCMACMLDTNQGKLLALRERLLDVLYDYIHHTDPEIYTAAVYVLMFATLKMRAKIQVLNYPDMPARLIELARNWQNETNQIYCFKALTNICEHPTVKINVYKNYLNVLESIQVKEADIRRYKEILLDVVTSVANIDSD